MRPFWWIRCFFDDICKILGKKFAYNDRYVIVVQYLRTVLPHIWPFPANFLSQLPHNSQILLFVDCLPLRKKFQEELGSVSRINSFEHVFSNLFAVNFLKFTANWKIISDRTFCLGMRHIVAEVVTRCLSYPKQLKLYERIYVRSIWTLSHTT